MARHERKETNHGTAGGAVADATPKGGDGVMAGKNGTWHADCFEGAAQEGSDMERDDTNTSNTNKERNTNDKDRVLLTDEEIDAGMTAHEGLVRHLAGRIAEGSGARADDDLLQEGRMGLWEGLKRYDKARGNRQSTYVAWWIRRGILRELERRRRYAGFFTESLQEPVGEDGATRADLYADALAADPGDEAEREEAWAEVRERMAALRAGDREAVELYYGLKDGKPRTLRDVAAIRNCSIPMAHKVVRRALDGLRPPPAA